eukprot:6356768-Lingulodinium_polyedra.AAC.1
MKRCARVSAYGAVARFHVDRFCGVFANARVLRVERALCPGQLQNGVMQVVVRFFALSARSSARSYVY